MSNQLLDGGTVEDPRLDRLLDFDPRSRNYPVATLLGDAPPRSYTWAVPGGAGQVLDQGREGACVGFAWAAERAARPVARPTTDADALEVYRHAQTLDPWPGEAPAYHGTSVLAGAQAAQAKGWLRSYRWAFGLDDVLRTVGRLGPVVLGIPWYSSMYDAPGGKITVSGTVVGGHAILARGVSVKRETVLLRNSWGPRYGRDGDAEITWADLDRLLRQGGEACVPILR